MKVYPIKNNISLGYKTSFRGGLTAKMRAEINACDVKKISDEFFKNKVAVNFSGNKTLAWCSLQCLNIIKKLNLGLPVGIFVEDFNNLEDTAEKGVYSFCTTIPDKIVKDWPKTLPERIIFYDKNIDWNKIDEISDDYKELGLTSSNFFLENFFHENGHAMHIKNLLKNLGAKKYVEALMHGPKMFENNETYDKYAIPLYTQVCLYATKDPFEAVACDIAKRITDNLNKETFELNMDFFEKSPYGKNSSTKTELSFLKDFWNGKLTD